MEAESGPELSPEIGQGDGVLENIVSDDDSPLLSDKEGEIEATAASKALLAQAPATGDEILDFEEGEDNSDDEPASEQPSEALEAADGTPKAKKDDDEEGEVNSEDDLEEGEVKEDDDEGAGKSETGDQQQHKQKSVCRFFGAGKCTWGDSCRFYHEIPESKRNQQGGKAPLLNHPSQGSRNYNFPPGRQPGPLIRHPPPPPRHGMPPHDFYPPPPGPLLPLPPPHQPPLLPLPSAESSWERGVRSAKKMVAEASKRKELELDFEEKRMNQGIEPEPGPPPPRDMHYHSRHPHHSRSPSPRHRGRSPSPYYREREFRDHREPPMPPPPRGQGMDRDRHHHRDSGRDGGWDSEYARRHRLAFESAPWNDEGPAARSPPHHRHDRGGGRSNPEQFRDPWRRSKSPGSRRDRPPPHVRPGGSDTGSDLSGSSDMSGSESSGSFKGKKDLKKQKKQPEPKPRVDRRPPPKDILPRGNQPDVSRLPRIPKLNRPKESNADAKYSSSSRAPPSHREGYDSWSNSNSDLSSDSDSDTRRRRHYRNYNEKSQSGRGDKRRNEEPEKREHLSSSKRHRSNDSGPPARSQSPMLSPPNKHIASPERRDSPHKKEPGFSMRFNRKVNTLQKTSVSERLNGRRSDSDNESENGSGLERTSGPTSPRIEGSVSPGTRDLEAQQGDMNRLLAKEAEVSSTTTSSRREALLKQLREIEAAIARKKQSTN